MLRILLPKSIYNYLSPYLVNNRVVFTVDNKSLTVDTTCCKFVTDDNGTKISCPSVDIEVGSEDIKMRLKNKQNIILGDKVWNVKIVEPQDGTEIKLRYYPEDDTVSEVNIIGPGENFIYKGYKVSYSFGLYYSSSYMRNYMSMRRPYINNCLSYLCSDMIQQHEAKNAIINKLKLKLK